MTSARRTGEHAPPASGRRWTPTGTSAIWGPGGAGVHLSEGTVSAEPQDKPLLRTEDLDFTDYPRPDASMEAMLEDLPRSMVEKLWQCGDSLLCCATGCRGRCWEPSATGSWSPVSCMTGWGESGALRLCAAEGRGRALLISGLWVPDGNQQRELGQAAADGGVYHGTGAGVSLRPVRSAAGAEHSYVLNLLRRQGFVPAPVPGRPVLEVDMQLPHRAEPQRGHLPSRLRWPLCPV